MRRKPNFIPPGLRLRLGSSVAAAVTLIFHARIRGNTGQYLNTLHFVKRVSISLLQVFTFPINLCSQTWQEYLELFVCLFLMTRTSCCIQWGNKILFQNSGTQNAGQPHTQGWALKDSRIVCPDRMLKKVAAVEEDGLWISHSLCSESLLCYFAVVWAWKKNVNLPDIFFLEKRRWWLS